VCDFIQFSLGSALARKLRFLRFLPLLERYLIVLVGRVPQAHCVRLYLIFIGLRASKETSFPPLPTSPRTILNRSRRQSATGPLCATLFNFHCLCRNPYCPYTSQTVFKQFSVKILRQATLQSYQLNIKKSRLILFSAKTKYYHPIRCMQIDLIF
jgi:hypothetical protein